MGSERDDRANRAAVCGVHADHCDVPVAELVGVPADDRPALDPLPAIDGDLIGDRAPEPEPRRAQAAGGLDGGRHHEIADRIAVAGLFVVPLRVAPDLRPAGCRWRRVGVLRVEENVVSGSVRPRPRCDRGFPAPRCPSRRRGRLRRGRCGSSRRRGRGPWPPSARRSRAPARSGAGSPSGRRQPGERSKRMRLRPAAVRERSQAEGDVELDTAAGDHLVVHLGHALLQDVGDLGHVGRRHDERRSECRVVR